MKKVLFLVAIAATVSFLGIQEANAQKKAGPVFVDGMTQVVPEFNNPADWIIHDLWVETTFDTDGDGKLDRVHVDVTRPKQTATEKLKLPVI